MDFLLDQHLWISLFSLTALEIILGIDNVIFISLTINHLPERQHNVARITGLVLALLMRIILLFSIVWVISLENPWVKLFGFEFSGKDMMLLFGGLFLLAKSTSSIGDEVTGAKKENYASYKGAFTMTMVQIVLIDFVFSFDSVITAVGLTNNIVVIILAMTIAMLVMLLFSQSISNFIMKNSTLKMLALTFMMMIGVFLIAEGVGFHIPKGYIYFSMAFSLGVETLNIIVRNAKQKDS